MSTTLSLEIEASGIAQYCLQDQWSIAQNFGRQGDMATFVMRVEKPGDGSSLTIASFRQLRRIVFYDNGLGNRVLFGGIISRPKLMHQGPNLDEWELLCRDNTFLADQTIVVASYVNQTADFMVKNLTAQKPIGLTTNGVQPGPQIPQLKITYLPLSQAWTRISQNASTYGVSYGWFVDQASPSLSVAPDVKWFNATQIPYSGTYFTDNPADTTPNVGHYARNWKYLWDAAALRNRIIVRGASYTNKQTDQFVGNGSQSSWPLTFQLDTTGALTLTVGGLAKTVALDTGSQAATTQWLVTQNKNLQWFLRTGTDPVPATGTTIIFSYSYQAPVITQVDDLTSQSIYATLPNKGIFEMYLSDPSLTNVTQAKMRGMRDLQEYSTPQERVEFTTTEDWLGHVRTGDIIGWQCRWVADSQASPPYSQPIGAGARFQIVSNTIRGQKGSYRTYSITAVRLGVKPVLA